MKQQFTMHLNYGELYREQGGFVLFSSKGMSDKWNTYVKAVQVEVDIPDNFDPTPAKIAALREEETKVRAELSARITAIQRQIQSLLAIENTVDAE